MEDRPPRIMEQAEQNNNNNQSNSTETIAIIGLGYVGLPLAVKFAHHFKVIGFDMDRQRPKSTRNGAKWWISDG